MKHWLCYVLTSLEEMRDPPVDPFHYYEIRLSHFSKFPDIEDIEKLPLPVIINLYGISLSPERNHDLFLKFVQVKPAFLEVEYEPSLLMKKKSDIAEKSGADIIISFYPEFVLDPVEAMRKIGDISRLSHHIKYSPKVRYSEDIGVLAYMLKNKITEEYNITVAPRGRLARPFLVMAPLLGSFMSYYSSKPLEDTLPLHMVHDIYNLIIGPTS